MQPDRTAELKTCLERYVLVLDGAMGTMIQRHGLQEADYRGSRFAAHAHDVKGNNDLLVLTQPDLIRSIHAEYLAAGADIIETNTFNSTSVSQADYHLEAIVHELNVAGARLARSVCDEFWLVSRGGIEPFDGDLDDYQRYLLDEARRAREDLKESLKATREETPVPVQAAPVVNKKISDRLKTLRRDLGKLEQRILDLQTRKHALEARLATPLPPQEIGALGLELQAIQADLDAQEERWLEVSEEIEVESAA